MAALSKERRSFLTRSTLQYMKHLGDAAEWLGDRGIDLEHARQEGLGVVRNPEVVHDYLEGRLAIPYLTDAGPVGMSFRCLKSHRCKEVGCKKYRKEKGSDSLLYGVQAMSWADEWIAVAEGELDSMVLRQIGIPAVGVPGAENWKPHWKNVFEDFSRVYVFTDGDTAGDDLFESFRSGLDIAVVKVAMPDGEDVNSMFMKSGADWLISKIKK